MSLQSAIDAITAQQPKVRNDIWMVGEQLKDMIRAEPKWADMIEMDIKNKDQNLEAIAKKIRERASKNKVGGVGCVTPAEADEIIVLHEGRIAERGRHEDLLARGGYYKKLNDMQAL